MAHDLSDYRKSYEKRELLENNCPKNPIEFLGILGIPGIPWNLWNASLLINICNNNYL